MKRAEQWIWQRVTAMRRSAFVGRVAGYLHRNSHTTTQVRRPMRSPQLHSQT
ncbi:hypothetical protein XCR_2671 [Xanthomonas campestris pv. raphani 756C]|nr:hypothetical protein XCR_2671 [Xanthomonas campestris pv. raphani 756C]